MTNFKCVKIQLTLKGNYILRNLTCIVVITLLTLWGCSGTPAFETQETEWSKPEERQRVDLSGTLKTANQKDVFFTDLPGNILVLNFWATWCAPCLVEMPSMASLYTQLSPDGLTMVALSTEDSEVMQKFFEKKSYPFDVWLDSDSVFVERFQVQQIPTTLVIDHQGRLITRQLGARQWDSPEMIERFRQLLNEPQS